MAASKSPKKQQVMDVAKPGQTAADPTGRPIIVKHKPMMKDPMVSAPTEGTKESTDVEQAKTTSSASRNVVIEVPSTAVAETKTEDTTNTEEPTQPSASESETNTPEPESNPEPATADDEKPLNEDDDSAVVDAVAEQVELGNQQKKLDKEEAARQEMIGKLVAEKKYELPIKQQSGTGSSKNKLAVLILVLLLALGGGYVAADAGYINLPFALPFHVMPQKAKAPVTNTMPVTSVTTKTTPTTPKTTTTTLKDVAPVLSATFSGPTASYTNKDLGVSFNYPKIWGDIKLATEQSELKKGSRYVLTFSNLKLISAGLLTRDYEEPARDGHCPTTLGIYPAATLESYRNGYKEGDSETNTSTAKSSTRILLSNSQEFVYENFFAGENDGYPVCNSVTLGGLRGFATKSPTTGIEFFWSTMDTAKEIPVSEFATYKNDPTKYMANADRQDLLAVVKSVKEL